MNRIDNNDMELTRSGCRRVLCDAHEVLGCGPLVFAVEKEEQSFAL